MFSSFLEFIEYLFIYNTLTDKLFYKFNNLWFLILTLEISNFKFQIYSYQSLLFRIYRLKCKNLKILFNKEILGQRRNLSLCIRLKQWNLTEDLKKDFFKNFKRLKSYWNITFEIIIKGLKKTVRKNKRRICIIFKIWFKYFFPRSICHKTIWRYKWFFKEIKNQNFWVYQLILWSSYGKKYWTFKRCLIILLWQHNSTCL